MAKLDPKLLKKVSQSKLISCATEIGIKNADKVQKEILINAFLDAVEKLYSTDPDKLKGKAGVVNFYNEVVAVLGLDGEEAAPEEGAEGKDGEPPEETPTTPEPDPEPVPPMTRRIGRPAAPAPAAPTPATAEPKAPKAVKEPKPPKEKKEKVPPKAAYTRHHALRDSLAAMKGEGKIDDLVNSVNETYKEKVGRDNPNESKLYTTGRIALLEVLGYVKVDGDNFKVLK